MSGLVALMSMRAIKENDLARLSHVIVNLGLSDKLKTRTMEVQDANKVIACIRSADKHAETLGKLPFPWTDQEIIDRLM